MQLCEKMLLSAEKRKQTKNLDAHAILLTCQCIPAARALHWLSNCMLDGGYTAMTATQLAIQETALRLSLEYTSFTQVIVSEDITRAGTGWEK